MDQTIHPVSWQASSHGNGRGGGHGVLVGSRHRQGGKRVDAEPGAQCRVVLVLSRARPAAPVDGHHVRAQRPVRLPVVLSRSEVAALLARMHGPVWIMASLMYGAGLRLQECVELRVKDLNFDRREVMVRDGKGGKDRVTMLPDGLRCRVTCGRNTRMRHWSGRGNGSFARRATTLIRRLERSGGIISTSRWSSGRSRKRRGHLLESGYDIRTIQELLGHRDVNTAMIYTHVLNQGGRGVRSPLDQDGRPRRG